MDEFQKHILQFNTQLGRKGLVKENLALLGRARPDCVLVFGMGGSGMPGEILRSVQDELGLGVPVVSWKDYGIPSLAEYKFRRPFYLFSSFSGNTEEPVSAFRAWLKTARRPAGAVVAGGGKLLREARKRGVPCVSFDPGTLQPRQGVGRMFYGALEALHAVKLISHMGFDHTRLRPLQFKHLGEQWAAKLAKRLITIYTDRHNYATGYAWKTRFNENAKQEAFLNTFPEMNHHEIIPLAQPHFKNAALFITEPKLSAPMAKRLRVNQEILKKSGVPVFLPVLSGKTRLERIWKNVMLADWVTYYITKRNGENPGNIEILEELKRKLRG